MSQNIGTLVTSAIRINDSNDQYASAFANEIRGGHHNVATIALRNAMGVWLREPGMTCYVQADQNTYRLQDDLTTWVINTAQQQLDLDPTLGDTTVANSSDGTARAINNLRSTIRNYKPAGGANYAKLLYWSEFPGTIVKLDKYSRPMNAFKNFNIDALDVASCITDTQYTIKNYIARVPQIKGYVYQPIWYITTGGSHVAEDQYKIYPALGSIWQNLGELQNNFVDDVRKNQWTVQGLVPFAPAGYSNLQCYKFPFSTLLGGTPSDDDMVSLGRYIVSLGLEFCIDPWPIGINRDDVAPGDPTNPQDWRGYAVTDEADIVIDPSGTALHSHTFVSGPHAGETHVSFNYLITDFDIFLDSFYNFMIYYPTLMYNNGIELTRYYIGSEYAGISCTSNELNRRKWIATLIRVDQHYKSLFPNGVSVYAANWQGELKDPAYDRWTLDELWASGIDRLGIDYYPPIGDAALDHTDPDEGYIVQNLVSNESADFYFTNADYVTQQTLTGTNKKGKQGLLTAPLIGGIGDKNIAAILNNHHYDASLKNDGSYLGTIENVPARSTLMPGTDISKAFYTPANYRGLPAITKIDGSTLIPKYLYTALPDGKLVIQAADAPDTDLCYADLTTFAAKFTFDYPTFEHINIKYKQRFTTGTTMLRSGSSLGNIFNLLSCIDVYFDPNNGNALVFSYKATVSSTPIIFISTIIWSANSLYEIEVSGIATRISVSCNGDIFYFTAPTGDTFHTPWTTASTNSISIAKDCPMILSYFEVGEDRFSFACFFEEAYAQGTRTCYQPMTGWITETGVASVDGSNVQSNAVPFAITTFFPPALDFDNLYSFVGDKTFWDTLSFNNIYVKDLNGPYGSNFSLDELGQAVAITKLVEFLNGRNFEDVTIYGFDLRPPEVYTYINGGQPYFIDSPNYGLGQNLTGKLGGGYKDPKNRNILQQLTPNQPAATIGLAYDAAYSNGEVQGANAGTAGTVPLVANVNYLPYGTIAGATITQVSDGIRFDEPNKLRLKPDVSDHAGVADDVAPLLDPATFTTSLQPIQYTLHGGNYQIWAPGAIFNNIGYQISASILELAPSSGAFRKSSCSQYTINAVIKVNTGSITPNAVGIGITGKDIPYYVSTSYLTVDLDTTSIHYKKARIKTIRGGGGGLNYQDNGDNDVISDDLFPTIDLTKDFTFTYKRNVYTYTWVIEHNGYKIQLQQPAAWQGGGKVGSTSVINLGGSYTIKAFNWSMDVAKNVICINPGASIDEGNQTDLFRFMIYQLVGYFAEGGSRPAEFIRLNDTYTLMPPIDKGGSVTCGRSEWSLFTSVDYASWDYMVNGLNWANAARPSDFLAHPERYPYHYEREDVLCNDGSVRRGDKSHMIEIVNALCQLPGIKKVFIKSVTPYNVGFGALHNGGREYSQWGYYYWGPDGGSYTSVNPGEPSNSAMVYPPFAFKDKVILIDNFTTMADQNPEHPIAGTVQGPYGGDPRYVQPIQPAVNLAAGETADSLLDIYGARGHIYGQTLDLLHFNGYGNQVKTANELITYRKPLLASRDGVPYTDADFIEVLSAPNIALGFGVGFIIEDHAITIEWTRQVNRQLYTDNTKTAQVPFPNIPIIYELTINGGNLNGASTSAPDNDGLLFSDYAVQITSANNAQTNLSYRFGDAGHAAETGKVTPNTRYSFSLKALAINNVGGYTFLESPSVPFLQKTSGNALADSIMVPYLAKVATAGGTLSTNHSDALKSLLVGLASANLTGNIVYFNPGIGDQLAAAKVNVINVSNVDYMSGNMAYDTVNGVSPVSGSIATGFNPTGLNKQNFTVINMLAKNAVFASGVLVGNNGNLGITHASLLGDTNFRADALVTQVMDSPYNAVDDIIGNHIFTMGTGLCTWYYNGKLINIGYPAPAGNFGSLPISINTSGAYANMYFNIALNQQQVATVNTLVNAFLFAINRANYTNPDVYVFEGDDITSSYSPTAPGNIYSPTYLEDVYNAMAGLDSNTDLTNSSFGRPAFSGKTAQYALLEAQVASPANIYNDFAYNSSRRNVLVYSMGTNDLIITNPSETNMNTLAATVYNTYIKPYLTIRRAAGYKVLIETITNSTTYSGTTSALITKYNSFAPALNTLIKNDPDNAGFIVDTASLAHYNDTTNTTYFSDGLHPTPALAVIRAALVAQRILDVRGTVPVPPGTGGGTTTPGTGVNPI